MINLKEKHVYAILALITVFAYYPIYKNQFVNWDDPSYITANLAVQNFLIVPLLFKTCLSNYHPLTMLSIALDYKIFGENPFALHAINLLYHIANTILLYWLMLCLAPTKRYMCLWLALIFTLHPLHVESVAWFSERKDVLSTLFYLWGLIVYSKANPYPAKFLLTKKYFLVFLLFFLALNSKSMSVTFPVILFLFDYLHRRKLTFLGVFEKLPFFVVSFLYGSINIWAQSSEAYIQRFRLNVSDLFTTSFTSYVLALSKSLFPIRLSMFYQRNIVTLTWLDYASALTLVTIIMAALLYYKKQRRDILWGTLFFFITFAPVSGIIPFGNLQIFADRYTYLPHVGLFYALGIIIVTFIENSVTYKALYQKLASTLIVLTILTYSLLTNQRVRVWENSETLMLDAINKYPESSVPYCNLGKAYKDKGDFDTAIKYYKMAISHDPEDPVPYNNLGHIYLKRGEKDLAKSHFEKAIELAPRYANSVYNLAIIYKEDGQLDEALKLYKRTISLDPFLYQAHNNLGNIYLSQGLVNEAIDAYKEAVKINPKFFQSQINLARTYHQAGMLELALKQYNVCLRLDPNNEEVKRNMSAILNINMDKK